MLKWFGSKNGEPEWQPYFIERPARKKINWQFWIGSPTAWLALFVSLATAFFTFFYQSDQLEVAVSAGPFRIFDAADFYVPRSVTFINSGTRVVTVLGVSQLIVQSTDQVPEPDCQHGYAQRLALNFEPVTVKPNEAVAKTPTSFQAAPDQSSMMKGQMFFNRLQTNELKPQYSNGQNFFPLLSTQQADSKPYQTVTVNRNHPRLPVFVVCMTFELVPPDSMRWYKTIEVLRTSGSTLPSLRFWLRDYPQYLIRRIRFRTQDSGDPPSNQLVDRLS